MTIQNKVSKNIYNFTISEFFTIINNGEEYEEAIDPLNNSRIYIESDNYIDPEMEIDLNTSWEIEAEQAYIKGVNEA